MKKFYFLLAAVCLYCTGFAQSDTVYKAQQSGDTIRIGAMIIVKKGKRNDSTKVYFQRSRPSNLTTNWAGAGSGVQQLY